MDKDNLALLILLLMCEELIDTIHSSEMDYSSIDYLRESHKFLSFKELVRQTRTVVSNGEKNG